MKAIHELLEAFIPLKYNFTNGQECLKWAEDRLLHDEEENDEDIILLAGSTEQEEIKQLSSKILERYIDKPFLEEEYCAGKFIVKLYESYTCGSVNIQRLDTIIGWLYTHLNYADWLVMLSRNCEYATDIEEFRKPFEDEFLYIYKIWKDACSVDAFKGKYDRQVSKSHDVTLLYAKKPWYRKLWRWIFTR
jgi:CheY-like chemotaxis protein